MHASPWTCVLLLGLGSVAAAADPPGTETTHATPAAISAETTPEPDLARQGGALYRQLCSHCHGIRMVNPGTSSFDLRQFPHDDRARFFNSVTRGRNTMPAWGDMLSTQEIEGLWAYVRTGGRT